MNAFKAYDIRGVYGHDFNASDVRKIGFFLPKLLNADTVLVGRDDRASSPDVFDALCDGITTAGADVVSMGLATTPSVYFAVAVKGFDAAVQITASHNPAEYNGLKVCKTGALPVDYANGLAELKRMCAEEKIEPASKKGAIQSLDIRNDYLEFLRRYLPALSGLKIGIDCSNGMASLLVHDLFGNTPRYLFDHVDGTFPNHPPNPLEEKNCADLQKLVQTEHLDIGLIFDGDADRVMFIDETGGIVQPDLITALLAEHFLAEEKGRVLHDIRSSKAVTERIRELGGEPHMWKVGHSFAKMKMRELGCIVGGELAGHYYFRDFFNCDSGLLTALIVLSVVVQKKAAGKPFSKVIDELMRYANSGEINLHIKEKDRAIDALAQHFTAEENPTAVYDFDGVRIEFADWWFNVRPSNTEPYLRLIIEADNENRLAEKRGRIEAALDSFIALESKT